MLNAKALLAGCVLLAATACATPVPFEYAHPAARLDGNSAYVLVVEPVEDGRSGDRSFDKILAESPCACVTTVMEDEMRAAGLFAEVVRQSETDRASQLLQSPDKKHLRVSARLLDLTWAVPGYGNIQGMRTASAVGFGVIGAVARSAYESSNFTPVIGRTTLAIQLTDADSGQPLLSKTYMGNASESRTISQCDTLQTRSHIVGRSTEDAMRQFTTDLANLLQSPPQPAAM